MSAATPGPWTVDEDGEVFPIGPDGEPVIQGEIAMVVSRNEGDRQLIAAAPTLVDALNEIVSYSEMMLILSPTAQANIRDLAETALRAAGRL